ncbi:MAG: hypothetical protein PHI90_01475 [Clostridia bacterium]|nr:hypothetical protein [Clostridia bacterium]MDD4047496.1 hypothetical protein [Clostridia bacterium]
MGRNPNKRMIELVDDTRLEETRRTIVQINYAPKDVGLEYEEREIESWEVVEFGLPPEDIDIIIGMLNENEIPVTKENLVKPEGLLTLSIRRGNIYAITEENGMKTSGVPEGKVYFVLAVEEFNEKPDRKDIVVQIAKEQGNPFFATKEQRIASGHFQFNKGRFVGWKIDNMDKEKINAIINRMPYLKRIEFDNFPTKFVAKVLQGGGGIDHARPGTEGRGVKTVSEQENTK